MNNTEYYIVDINDNNVPVSIEEEINQGIENIKKKNKKSFKYYFYKLFCCTDITDITIRK